MASGSKRALSESQRRTIFWQLNKLRELKKIGPGDDERRLIQLGVVGKESLADFTFADGKLLIEELKKLGARPRRKRQPKPAGGEPGKVVYLVTEAQKNMLEGLARQVWWELPDGYKRWMLSSFGYDIVRTNGQVTQVKHGLESLIAQQRRKGA